MTADIFQLILNYCTKLCAQTIFLIFSLLLDLLIAVFGKQTTLLVIEYTIMHLLFVRCTPTVIC